MKKYCLFFLILLTGFNLAHAVNPSDFFTAITTGNTEKVQSLLDSGANPNLHGPNGITPLIAAITSKQEDIIDLLFTAGADPNLQDTYGHSPLAFAVMASDEVLVNKLLSQGADPKAKNKFGQSPLDTAKLLKSNKIVIILSSQQTINSNKTTDATNNIITSPLVTSAKQNYKDGKDIGYFLGKKSYSILASNSSPIGFDLITPYSSLRYGFNKEEKTFIPFEDNDIQEVMELKDYAFISVFPTMPQSFGYYFVPVQNIVIRDQEGTIHRSISVFPNIFSKWGLSQSRVWAFPINLFNSQNIEIIAVDTYENKKSIKVSADKLKSYK